MKNFANTPEAAAVRSRRRQLQLSQRDDALAKRARLVAFWRACAETNSAYRPHNGCWWQPFTIQPGFRKLLMPALRARLDARDRERRERYAAELQESARAWARTKAERAAAAARARSPQLELL